MNGVNVKQTAREALAAQMIAAASAEKKAPKPAPAEASKPEEKPAKAKKGKAAK